MVYSMDHWKWCKDFLLVRLFGSNSSQADERWRAKTNFSAHFATGSLSDGSPVISSFTDTVPVLNDLEDRFDWHWSANGKYSAGSVYKILITAGKIKWGFVEIWKVPAVKQKGHKL